jgi:hypothetical protein
LTSDDRKAVFDNLVEPENRLAFITIPSKYKMMIRDNYKKGMPSIFEADENLERVYSGFQSHYVMKDIIHLKGSQLVESGIVNRHLKHVIAEELFTKPQEIGPQVLTVQHLSVGFIIIFGLLVLSIVVFMLECAPKLLRKLKKQFEMCLMCYVVVKFTKINKML